MNNILLITEQDKDDIPLRNQLEKIAFKLHGNLNGFRLDENKKVIYLFNFKDKKYFEKFKMEKLVKNFKITEE